MNVNEIEAILDDISLRKKLSIGVYNWLTLFYYCYYYYYLHKTHNQIRNSFVCFYTYLFIFLNLDLSNNEARHQTIRILNKLCVHSADGYEKTLEIFNFNKVVHFFVISQIKK